MEQTTFKCSGDCIRCNPIQRQYCASQFSYNTMRMVEDLQGSVNELRAKIEAIQGNEALLFDPTKGEKSEIPNLPIAQQGTGAGVESQDSLFKN